jgi:hypothetical protein
VGAAHVAGGPAGGSGASPPNGSDPDYRAKTSVSDTDSRAGSLARALDAALRPEVADRARDLASRMRDDGAAIAARRVTELERR